MWKGGKPIVEENTIEEEERTTTATGKYVILHKYRSDSQLWWSYFKICAGKKNRPITLQLIMRIVH